MNQTALEFCKPQQDQDKEYIDVIKDVQGTTYFNLGVRAFNGEDGPRDHQQAIKWFKQAARLESKRAQEELKEAGVRW